MDEIVISIAKVNDLTKILSLQKSAYLSEAKIYNDYNIPPLHQSLPEIEEEFATHLFLKAEYKGRIIGSVRGYTEKDVCYIGKLIVDGNHQNKGLGQELLQNIESHFPEVTQYELFTGSKSIKNLYLYKKQGYKCSYRKRISTTLTLETLKKENKIS